MSPGTTALTIILAGMLTLYEFDLIDPWRQLIQAA